MSEQALDDHLERISCEPEEMIEVEKSYLDWLESENASLTEKVERLEENMLPEVESCANWLEISIVQGGHCYNCVNREGYPWMARPSSACSRFALLESEQ